MGWRGAGRAVPDHQGAVRLASMVLGALVPVRLATTRDGVRGSVGWRALSRHR